MEEAVAMEEVVVMEEAAEKVIPVAVAEIHRADHPTGVAVHQGVVHPPVVIHPAVAAAAETGADHLTEITATADHQEDQEDPAAVLLQCQGKK